MHGMGCSDSGDDKRCPRHRVPTTRGQTGGGAFGMEDDLVVPAVR